MIKQIQMQIEQEMMPILNNEQMIKLQQVLVHVFAGKKVKIKEYTKQEIEPSNETLLETFIAAKRVEGCSEKSIKYYKATLGMMMKKLDKSVKLIMRDHCDTSRDLAIVDLLASTGMRVGELIALNREDIDFEN